MISSPRLHAARACAWPRTLIGPLVPISGRGRAGALGLSLLCAAILAVAAWLRPDPRGHGTHEQLGMLPCSFVLVSGLPCPTCGMTTAFSLMMHGHPLASILAQPAGAALCLATMALCLYSAWMAASGRMHWINWDLLGPVRLALVTGVFFLGGWGFKVVFTLMANRAMVG